MDTAESTRLAALRRYSILDTPPEPAFDDLAALAAQICETPIAMVTLIDEHRQWFKARLGLALRETPRELAFCAVTIEHDDVMVVPDASQDPRFQTNPFVTGTPGLRFYAGAPLVLADGQRLGTVAVADHVPRTLAPEQLEALRRLARQAVAQLELRVRISEGAAQGAAAVHLALERFELVAHATTDVVWDWDLTTNELWFNPNFARLFGHTDIAPTIDDWIQRLHPDDRERVKRGIFGLIESGEEYWSDEYRFERSDGTYADIFDRGYVQHVAGKPVRMIGAMMDITDRRRLEAQLRESQKFDAIGQLSGGIAHDFNNLLTVIQCNVALLDRLPAKGDASVTGAAPARAQGGRRAGDPRQPIDDILQATERGANLTRQLLLLGRKQQLRSTAIDVNTVVVDMTRMLRRIVGEHIELDARCPPHLPAIRADLGMLEQVLLNLVVNARDAMPAGGRLTISTGSTEVDEPQTSQGFAASPGRYVFICVRDTGTGIAPELMSRIFDPFFTTKEVGKGTGLGLATVHSIVRQHRGWIDVASRPGEGSTFCCYFPATDAVVEVRPPDVGEELPRGTETLLVVEDEVTLRRLLVSLLERSGYTVIHASTGPSALEAWRQHRDRIQLVLTDLVMPGGLSGIELVERLHADAPGLPVIYMSGYSPEIAASQEPLVEGENFLQKPYAPPALARAVRAQLDRAVGTPKLR